MSPPGPEQSDGPDKADTADKAARSFRAEPIDFGDVLYDVAGQVAVITLNRPSVMNVISARPGGTRDQIIAALEQAEGDSDVGCVVLRGNGRAFCGGGDLVGNARRETLDEDREFVEDAAVFHQRLRSSALPTIAAVHGHCLGAGVLLACSCDLVIAADSAQFGFPEGRLGLVGVTPLVATIGRQWATYLMLTGESVTATQARDLGIVLAVEPEAELHNRVLDLAARIARMPREGVVRNRRAIAAAADDAGDRAARDASLTHDPLTLNAAAAATAPDGRTFRSIIDAEGIEGMKRARLAQYTEPWLRR